MDVESTNLQKSLIKKKTETIYFAVIIFLDVQMSGVGPVAEDQDFNEDFDAELDGQGVNTCQVCYILAPRKLHSEFKESRITFNLYKMIKLHMAIKPKN